MRSPRCRLSRRRRRRPRRQWRNLDAFDRDRLDVNRRGRNWHVFEPQMRIGSIGGRRSTACRRVCGHRVGRVDRCRSNGPVLDGRCTRERSALSFIGEDGFAARSVLGDRRPGRGSWASDGAGDRAPATVCSTDSIGGPLGEQEDGEDRTLPAPSNRTRTAAIARREPAVRRARRGRGRGDRPGVRRSSSRARRGRSPRRVAFPRVVYPP